MEISLSKRIAIPLVLGLGFVLFFCYALDYPEYSFWIIPFVVLLAALFVMHRDLDNWWIQRHPRKLPRGMVRFIHDHIPLYGVMSKDQRRIFDQEVSVYLDTASFLPQGFEKVPEDLKVVIAAFGHLLSTFKPVWNKKIQSYDNIVFYRHPFPSPQFPKYLHSSEMFEEDHVLLFSTDHFMKAFRFPQQYFNSALYEWIKVVMSEEPVSIDMDIKYLAEISGFPNETIVQYIGLPEENINWTAVAATYFFVFPVRFKMHLEPAYDSFTEFFSVDPMKLFK
jgi:hypothetical protein